VNVMAALQNIGGHPSATGRVQNSKSSPAKDQRSTTVPQTKIGCHGNASLSLVYGSVTDEFADS